MGGVADDGDGEQALQAACLQVADHETDRQRGHEPDEDAERSLPVAGNQVLVDECADERRGQQARDDEREAGKHDERDSGPTALQPTSHARPQPNSLARLRSVQRERLPAPGRPQVVIADLQAPQDRVDGDPAAAGARLKYASVRVAPSHHRGKGH